VVAPLILLAVLLDSGIRRIVRRLLEITAYRPRELDGRSVGVGYVLAETDFV
jgi:hypothetical protein